MTPCVHPDGSPPAGPRSLPAAGGRGRLRPWLGLIASLLVLVGWLAWGAGSSDGARVPEVKCGKPERLELWRYEDGSAQLRCGRRLLVRVHVPW